MFHHLVKNVVDGVSFDVRGGEIVCIAGVDGNGQSELAQAISGLIKPKSGHIYLDGVDLVHKSIRYRNDHGLSHIPEDRQLHGLILNDTLAHNLNLKNIIKNLIKNEELLKKIQLIVMVRY